MTKIKINQETENPLLNRKEIEGELTSEITPSYKEIRKILSEKFSTPVEQIKVNNIKGRFGSHNFKINANIYSSKEALEETEKKSKKELAAEKAEADEITKQEEEKKAKEAPEENPAEKPKDSEENSEEKPKENSDENAAEKPKDSEEKIKENKQETKE